MIRDEDLKSSVDYSEGQKRAAHRVLVELVKIFQEYEEEIRVVGGWVPDLMFPEEGHVGSVDVDILAGMYGGTQPKRRSQHVQGIKALKATGGNFAFEFPAQKISVEAERPDGAMDVANVSVVAVVPYIIMKSIESNFVDLQASVISCNILSSGAEPLAKFPKPVRVRVEKCVCAAYKESRHINWDL